MTETSNDSLEKTFNARLVATLCLSSTLHTTEGEDDQLDHILYGPILTLTDPETGVVRFKLNGRGANGQTVMMFESQHDESVYFGYQPGDERGHEQEHGHEQEYGHDFTASLLQKLESPGTSKELFPEQQGLFDRFNDGHWTLANSELSIRAAAERGESGESGEGNDPGWESKFAVHKRGWWTVEGKMTIQLTKSHEGKLGLPVVVWRRMR